MKQKGIYFLLALLAAVGIFFVGASYNRSPEGSRPAIQLGLPDLATSKTVSLLIDSGDKLAGYDKLQLPKSANVLELLKQVTKVNKLKFDYDTSSPMGAFVKQIGEQVNGQDAKYWQYWVNGVQPMVAADKLELKGGETVLWTFRKSLL
ncbi:MAG: DUF4430 domain-containing protein [Candidatus Kerfeldbacteria bacterium]|nr:DUF4430 domain-containing protein [Candidatus Kerfeldbacteria bacterium]